MNRLKVLQELEQAYMNVVGIIRESSEHNQFNELYFEKPFKEWFAKKLDELSVVQEK